MGSSDEGGGDLSLWSQGRIDLADLDLLDLDLLDPAGADPQIEAIPEQEIAAAACSADEAPAGRARKPRWERWASPAERRAQLNRLTESLLSTARTRGFITLHELARAAAWLRYDEPLLDELRDRLDAEGVCATESVAHTHLRGARLDGIADRFAPLLARHPDERAILRRLGYRNVANIPPATRAFMVQAFTLHQLTRAEEEAHVRTIVAAREREDDAPDTPEVAAAKSALFHDNLWAVVRLARLYQGQGLPLDDLIQEGCLGILQAIKRYQVGRTHRFMAYAAWWIIQRMTRAIADTGRVVRLPVHLHEALLRLSAAEDVLWQQRGRAPRQADLAAALGIEADRVREMLMWRQEPLSLERLAEEQPTAVEIALVRDHGPSDDLSARSLRDDLNCALETLKQRPRLVVRLRFGLTAQGPMTLEEVGKQFGVTRERIRQMEKKALELLAAHPILRVHSRCLRRPPRSPDRTQVGLRC